MFAYGTIFVLLFNVCQQFLPIHSNIGLMHLFSSLKHIVYGGVNIHDQGIVNFTTFQYNIHSVDKKFCFDLLLLCYHKTMSPTCFLLV